MKRRTLLHAAAFGTLPVALVGTARALHIEEFKEAIATIASRLGMS